MIETPARVMVVDDQPLIRDAIDQLLTRDGGAEVIASVGSAGEALEAARVDPLDLVIVDIVLPGAGGISLAQRLKHTRATCKILGFSHVADPPRIAAMLRAGADGYAMKSQTGAELLDAIKCVLASKRYLPSNVDVEEVERLVEVGEDWPLKQLTQREQQVYQLLVAGYTNERIATSLSIARRTVETHRQHLMKKLGARTIVDLVHLSFQLGRS